MNKISEKGFLTFVQNSNSVDYLELAYLQALSIKLTRLAHDGILENVIVEPLVDA